MKKVIQFLFITVGCGLALFVYNGMDSSFAHEGHEGTEMHSHVSFRPVTMDELERFHGHLGPFVVLGAKMGEYAVTEYEMPRYFGVTVMVECPKEPPHSCLIDGLMVTSGATYGKKNIQHSFADKIRVFISNDENGDSVIFQLKDSTLERLQRWEKEETPISERGVACFEMEAKELFDIEYHEG